MLNHELDIATRPDSTHHDAKTAALSLFARRVAHDMNNFATVVRTYSELLMADLPPGSAHADLEEIHRAADAMVNYLRHIARFSRVESSRLAPVAVHAITADTLQALMRDEEGAPIEVTGGTTRQAHAEATTLADVVRELARNAREASPAGRPVQVELSDDGTWVQLRVVDRGAGFHESVIDRAEDPFVTTKQGVRGAGFGLTLASVFARHAGGRLTRERDGDRTAVTLHLRAV